MVAAKLGKEPHATVKTITLSRKRSITSDPITGESWCDAQQDGAPHVHRWSLLHDAAGYRQCLGSDCWAILAPDGDVLDGD